MKKFFTGTLLSGLILVSVSQATVLAQNTQTSDATVEFTQPDEDSAPPGILGPDGEDTETPDQETGDVTGSTGPLTIDYVSNFDFGDHEISVAEQTYTLESPEEPYVQVSDRRGTGAGWNLTVQASAFQNGEQGSSLPGATLSFNGGLVRTNLDDMTAPQTQGVTLLTGGDAQTVTTAEQGAGLGSWVTVWERENVQLTVPQAAASPGEHTSTLTWTLSDAPGTGSGGDVE